MKHYLLLISINCCMLMSFAQIQFDQNKIEFGEIQMRNQDIIDLDIYNPGNDTVYLLRLEGPRNMTYQYISMYLPPKSTRVFRLKLNPKITGNYKETVSFHFSSAERPANLKITGDVKNLPVNDLQACPDFRTVKTKRSTSSRSKGSRQYFQLKIRQEETIDEVRVNNTEPIARSNQEEIEVPEQKETKTKVDRRSQPSLLTKLFGDPTNTTSLNKNDDAEENTIKEKETEIEDAIEVDKSTNSDLLEEDLYKPNNVVFLIDASSSMKEEERIELLKKAMIALLEPLRPIDFLSIITYAAGAEVILDPTAATSENKLQIEDAINSVNADGSTNAVKGLNKALKVAQSNFIEDGENIIFLATDGAFNIGGGNVVLREKIKKSARNGIRTSVIAIKNERWTNKSLKELIELGNGDLLHIDNENRVKKVLENIKLRSKK